MEGFWFQAVIAGDETAVADVLSCSSNARDLCDSERTTAVLERYTRNIERSDVIIGTSSMSEAPAWWPESLFGSWRLDTIREIVLHVIKETAEHAGHLDVARELIASFTSCSPNDVRGGEDL